MTQNINLLVSGLRKTAVRYSFATLAKSVGAALVALFAIQFFLQYQVGSLTARLRSMQEVLKDQRAQAEKVTGQAAARKPDAALEAEIAKLEGELGQARESMSAIKGGAFGTQQGFAEYLLAFSRQSLDGLWLTAFSISGGGDIELRGRALRPELVPSYIQRLNREPVFTGRSFARFEMTRPTEPAADKKAAQPARYLEFSLATKEAVKMTERSQ